MTLKELKEKLEGYPEEVEILVRHYDCDGFPHDLPVMEDCEIRSSEQGGEFSDVIVLEANLDYMID